MTSPANDAIVKSIHVAEIHDTPDTVTGIGLSLARLPAGTNFCVVSLIVRFIVDGTQSLFGGL